MERAVPNLPADDLRVAVCNPIAFQRGQAMSEPTVRVDPPADASLIHPAFAPWRRAHRAASVVLGLGPCTMPTAPVVRAANWVFVIFGFGAFAAVPEPQAAVILAALVAQAVSGRRTLRGAAA